MGPEALTVYFVRDANCTISMLRKGEISKMLMCLTGRGMCYDVGGPVKVCPRF